MTTTFMTDGADAPVHLLFAHGAGAAMDSGFLDAFARAVAAEGVTCHRFEFAYMAGRRTGGTKRPPPPVERLAEEYATVVAELRSRIGSQAKLVIGGKSMGGRVASMAADGLHRDGAIQGLACVGYPFHPQGRPESLRTAHLETLACPAIICQGERDAFGNRAEVAAYPLSPAIELVWIGDGDHDLGPRGRSGFTKSGNITAAAQAITAFARRL